MKLVVKKCKQVVNEEDDENEIKKMVKCIGNQF